MTCIVALRDEDNKTILMGADSNLGTPDLSGKTMDLKIFPKTAGPKGQKILMGYSGSPFAGQVAKYDFEFPKQKGGQEDIDYLFKSMSKLRDLLMFHTLPEDQLYMSSYLIAFNGFIYSSDMHSGHVSMEMSYYYAIGSGAPYALASLYSTTLWEDPYDRVTCALKAAEEFHPLVRSPFYINSVHDDD